MLHFSYFTACHTTIDIGLVGEDEQACAHESLSDAVSVVVRPANEGKNAHFLQEQRSKLLPTVIDPLSVRCVYNPDEAVGLLEVVLPV